MAQTLQTQVTSTATAPKGNAKAGKLGAFNNYLSGRRPVRGRRTGRWEGFAEVVLLSLRQHATDGDPSNG